MIRPSVVLWLSLLVASPRGALADDPAPDPAKPEQPDPAKPVQPDPQPTPQPPRQPIETAVEPAPTPAVEPGPSIDELQLRIEDLEQRLKMQQEAKKPRFPVKITGYGDLGFFATSGDGAGIRRDAGHLMFPDRRDIAWVFYGDLLAPTVNTRGDVADLGEVPGVDRFDTLGSNGNPTFLVNEINLTVKAGLGERALFQTSVNFTPRTGRDFRLGDSIDADLAELEWMPTEDGKTSIFVGKVDSVIGHEYKSRKPPARFGITPSLLARYTVGTAVGLKARTKLLGDKLVLAGAITNGSFGTEQFHFFSEVDSNSFKTLSGRAAVRIPVGNAGQLETGISGQIGTQDGTPDGAGQMWFAGLDAELELGRFNFRAQWLMGEAPGDDITMAYSLDLKNGGYFETTVIVTPIIGLLGRIEFRDAEVQQGMERLYITKNWRSTIGARFIFTPNAIVKAEYSHNGEYGGVPSIPDDVITTSAVMAF